ncbi:MAG TPA: hypothetical protein PKV72_04005 [Candidatus Peribacteria bacterium]|nr:hypothetical protein [Candidatus Peribacteria bacterium]
MTHIHTNTLSWLPFANAERTSTQAATRSLAATVALAFGIVVFQVFVVCLFARPIPFAAKYQSFIQWDSNWYAHVATVGYKNAAPANSGLPDRTNVTFLPAYPLAADLVKMATGWNIRIALLVAAQLAAVGFWIYFLLICERWGFTNKAMIVTGAVILVFPTAFYFAAGYTESLFAMNLLGFFYWTADTRKYAWIPAALHGFLLGFTRIIGFALAVVPFFSRGFPSAVRRPSTWFVAAATLAGPLTFLAYIQWKFGDWHLFLTAANSPGWGQRADFMGLLDPKMYRLFWPNMTSGLPKPDDLSRLSYPLMLIGMAAVAMLDAFFSLRRAASGFRERLPLYVGVIALWVVYAGARYHSPSGSIRYMLPIFALLALAVAHLTHNTKGHRLSHLMEFLLPAFFIICIILQTGYIAIFTGGGWIA